MAFMLILYATIRADALNQALSILATDDFSNVKNRNAAINKLAEYALLDHPLVIGYYKNALEVNPAYFSLLTSEMISRSESTDKLVLLICDNVQSHGHRLLMLLEKLYFSNKNIINGKVRERLLDITIMHFENVIKKNPSNLSGIELKLWLDMCTCRSILGDASIIQICNSCLLDKRVINNLNRLANTPSSRPIPYRVCDYCIISILYYNRCDIVSIFKNNGINDISLSNISILTEVMFDRVISNRFNYIPK